MLTTVARSISSTILSPMFSLTSSWPLVKLELESRGLKSPRILLWILLAFTGWLGTGLFLVKDAESLEGKKSKIWLLYVLSSEYRNIYLVLSMYSVHNIQIVKTFSSYLLILSTNLFSGISSLGGNGPQSLFKSEYNIKSRRPYDVISVWRLANHGRPFSKVRLL